MIVPAETLHFYRLCGTSMYSKVLAYISLVVMLTRVPDPNPLLFEPPSLDQLLFVWIGSGFESKSFHLVVERIERTEINACNQWSGSGPVFFGPPGSESVIYLFGSGSGSGTFHQHTKNMKKSLVFFCYMTSLCCKYTFKKDKSIKLKRKKKNFLLASRRSLTKRAGSGSVKGTDP